MRHFLGVFSRMKFAVLSFLLFTQLHRIFASELLEPSKACGTYHVGYSDDYSHELFYINGDLVDKRLFCNALIIEDTNHCFKTRDVGYRQCGLEFSLDKFSFDSGRRFLREAKEHDSVEDKRDKNRHSRDYLLTSRSLAMAMPAAFVLCCALICPCLRAKRKDSSRDVLANDPVSVDSAAPLEPNYVHEKVMPSPLRVPPSPMRVPPSPSRFSMSPGLNRIGSVHLTMTEALRVTQNFSPALKIGDGGFGSVYKAQLPNGVCVAIKRAKKEHIDTLNAEFKSEVELLAKIEHRNLVRLLGYVDKGRDRLIITEFVPNGTLREHLDGARGKVLDFNQRLEISIDVGHALTYLHMYAEKPIIHRDVKSSNILLTESMRAKVADFGFARLGDTEADKTHISTKVKGTVGYLDPEYMKTYQLTPKSDVYSFGVLLLEILTSRRPVEMRRPPEERVTLRWAFAKYNEGRMMEMVDPSMTERIDREIVAKMFELAFQCAAPTRADRPDMKAVGERLWAIRMDYMRRGRR